jgi:long-subunit acyl-CoA synthetase (AMP-forming)
VPVARRVGTGGQFRSLAGGQLTATLKLRRHVIVEQYAAQIAALYDDDRAS